MRYIYSLLIFLIGLRVSAQDFPSNPLDNTYTPPKGSIFDLSKGSAASKSVANRNRSDFSGKNLVGFNPFLLGRSIFAVQYERFLGETFGISAAVGFTFATDYIRLYTSKLYSSDVDGSGSDLYKSHRPRYQNLNSYGASSNLNPYLHLQANIFFDDDPTDGPYMGLFYRYYANKLVYGGETKQENVNPTPTFTMRFHSLGLVFGRRGESSNAKIVHDFYYGAGFRISSMPIYDLTFLDPETAEFQDAYIFRLTEERDWQGSLMLMLGYSLSFGF